MLKFHVFLTFFVFFPLFFSFLRLCLVTKIKVLKQQVEKGIIPRFDPNAQVYTFVEGEIFTLVRQVENTIDLELDKGAGYNIQILSAGRLINVMINGGGENEIIINQSD